MPNPPSAENYQVGGAIVILGGVDLGNVVNLGIDPTDMDILQHLTARSGSRKVDKQVVTRKRLTFRVELDEHATGIYRQYFMGGGTGLAVTPLVNPLAETNCVIRWLNESVDIWSYSHTKVTSRPARSMDFNSFGDWATFEIEIEALVDAAVPTAPLGTFTFTA